MRVTEETVRAWRRHLREAFGDRYPDERQTAILQALYFLQEYDENGPDMSYQIIINMIGWVKAARRKQRRYDSKHVPLDPDTVTDSLPTQEDHVALQKLAQLTLDPNLVNRANAPLPPRRDPRYNAAVKRRLAAREKIREAVLSIGADEEEGGTVRLEDVMSITHTSARWPRDE